MLKGIQNPIANDFRRQRRQKRGGDVVLVSIDEEQGENRYRLEPASEETAQTLFDRSWAFADAVHQFTIEAKAGAALSHANIVPVFEIGEHDSQCYFSMKLVRGGKTISELAVGEGASLREQRRVAGVMACVARAVAYAHSRGVLHRDIKPANILLDEGEVPMLTDFDLAKLLEGFDVGSNAVCLPSGVVKIER